MKQATTRKNDISHFHLIQRLREGAFILLCSMAIYLLIALVTYHHSDTAWSHSGMSNEILNAAGKTGAWFSDILLSLFGYMAYIFPLALALCGAFLYQEESSAKKSSTVGWRIRGVGLLMILLTSCGLTSMHLPFILFQLPMSTGGLLGNAIQTVGVAYLNSIGSTVILSALFLIGVTLFSGLSWFGLMRRAGESGLALIQKFHTFLKSRLQKIFLKISSISFPNAKLKGESAA